LKELAAFRQLESLDLGFDEVSDAGALELEKLKRLTWLFLGGTDVTESAKAKLERAIPGCVINLSPEKLKEGE
jgi:hypothetical protein